MSLSVETFACLKTLSTGRILNFQKLLSWSYLSTSNSSHRSPTSSSTSWSEVVLRFHIPGMDAEITPKKRSTCTAVVWTMSSFAMQRKPESSLLTRLGAFNCWQYVSVFPRMDSGQTWSFFYFTQIITTISFWEGSIQTWFPGKRENNYFNEHESDFCLPGPTAAPWCSWWCKWTWKFRPIFIHRKFQEVAWSLGAKITPSHALFSNNPSKNGKWKCWSITESEGISVPLHGFPSIQIGWST